MFICVVVLKDGGFNVEDALAGGGRNAREIFLLFALVIASIVIG